MTCRGCCNEEFAVSYPPPEGGYTVIVPSLARACVTFGGIVEEATAMAREAARVYVEGLLEKGEESPAPLRSRRGARGLCRPGRPLDPARGP